MTADLLDHLPGADLVRVGLQDRRAGRDTVESCLVEIARPRLERAGLLEPAPHRLDAEIQLYRHLGSRSANPHGLYNSLLRELVSFEHALDHRLAKENAKCETGEAERPSPKDFNHTQVAGRPLGNRGAGMRRDRLPQGSSEGEAYWEICESNCRRQPKGRDEWERASQMDTDGH